MAPRPRLRYARWVDDALLVIDEGTSSTRAVLVEADGRFTRIAQEPVPTAFPRPGWVEQDAAAIWQATLRVAREAAGGDADRIRAIGITNQRETIVAWDARTGQPLAPAIVWQDRRTASACQSLAEAGHESRVQQTTGLLLDPYFSATKIRWLLDQYPDLAAAGDHLRFGAVDSWLVAKLTGGAHRTDATNASRTLLMDLEGGWDDGLCDLFGIPRRALPEIADCTATFGTTTPDLFGRLIPITGIAGDQQAAAIGQGCLSIGDTKATFGTGAFILSHAGAVIPRSAHRLLSTVAWQIGSQRTYALEGSLFVAGQMIQWLRDEMGIVPSSHETAALARSVSSSEGVTIVPAFAGLGAPHWRPDARATIAGLTLGTTRAHLVRSALEAVTNQSAELQRAFAADGVDWTALRIDGGMAANDFLAQDLADVLAVPVERPDNVESTVLGAAMLAAVGCGLYPDLAIASQAMRPPATAFIPLLDCCARKTRLTAWDRAVAATLAGCSG